MGIFDQQAAQLFTTYAAQIVFRDKLMGGTPKDPRIITAWLRTKTGVTDEEELRQMMLRTLLEMGGELPEGVDPRQATYAQLVEASERLANNQAVGFKRGDGGLYMESRTIKAMLKECTNVLFAGERWGATKKGPRSFLAERVFVNPDKVWLGTQEPTGIELFIGHTSGPKGPQSNLTYYEYVERAAVDFEVMVVHDDVLNDHWPLLWLHAQENGLGALRSQGFGRFDVERWEKCGTVTKVPKAFEEAAKEPVAA